MKRIWRHTILVIFMLVVAIPVLYTINANSIYDEWIKRLASFILGCAFSGFIWEIREELS